MPSRKQKRRHQKLQRHEYEEVYVDADGNELAPEEAEELVATRPAKAAKATRQQPAQRGGRTVEPPSWRRTGKRALLFAPLMLLTLHVIDRELAWATKFFNTVLLMAFFLPFSYFMDTMVWRSYQRRLARTDPPKK